MLKKKHERGRSRTGEIWESICSPFSRSRSRGPTSDEHERPDSRGAPASKSSRSGGSSVTASVSIATLNLPSHASPSSLGASDGKKDSLTPPQQMTSLAPPHGLQIPSVTVTAVHGPHPAASASVAVASASSYTMTPAIPIPEINDNAGNEIFAETLDRNKDGLSPSLRNAFMNASPEGINNLLDSFNQQHGQKSLTRKYAAHSVVKDFLDVAGGFLKILGMFVQYCPDITPLILGGLTTFVQIGTRYADFFEMMSDAVEKLRDELKFLSLYAKLYSDYPAVKKALCTAYADIIEFFKLSCGIFMDKDSNLGKYTSAKLLVKQLFTTFERDLATIMARFTEHTTMVEKMSSILEQERKINEEKKEERIKILAWLSSCEPEEDRNRLSDKAHEGTGRWMTTSKELKDWFESEQSCLLWCHGGPGVGKSVLTSILLGEIEKRYSPDENIGLCFFYFSFQDLMTQNLSKVLAILIKQLCRLKKRIPDSLLALYKLRATNDSAPKLSELQASMETVVGSFTQVFLVIDAIDECSEADRKVLLPYIVKLFGECPGRLKIFATSRPEPDITRAFTSEMFNTIQIEAKKVDEDIKDYVKHELKHRIHEYCDIDEDLMSDIELTLTTKAGGMFLWVRCQLDLLYQQPSSKDIRDALESLPDDMNETYSRILKRIRKQPKARRELAERAFTWITTVIRPFSKEELAFAVAIGPDRCSLNEILEKYNPQTVIGACCGLLTVEYSGIGSRVRPVHFSVQEFLNAEFGGTRAHAEIAASITRYVAADRKEYELGLQLSKKGNNIGVKMLEYSFGTEWVYHIGKSSNSPGNPPDSLIHDLEMIMSDEHSKSRVHAYIMVTRYRRILELDGLAFLGEVSPLVFCAAINLIPFYMKSHILDLSSQELVLALNTTVVLGSVLGLSMLLDYCCAVDIINACVNGRTLLMTASSNTALIEVAQLLLDRGADINHCVPIIYQGWKLPITALETAIGLEKLEIVEFLLKNGADPNAQVSQGHGSALELAIYMKGQGYYNAGTRIIEKLLAAGADANIRPQFGRFGSALTSAVWNGDIYCVDLLLDQGADPNMQLLIGEFGSPLVAVVLRTRIQSDETISITKMLLNHGADINLPLAVGDYGSALASAAYHGDSKLALLFLDRGADINMDLGVGNYGSALAAAVTLSYYSGRSDDHAYLQATWKDHILITEALIGGGAAINAQLRVGYGSALAATTAPFNGNVHDNDGYVYDEPDILEAHEESQIQLAKTLLDNGADVNLQLQFCKYGSALAAAVYHGRTKISKFLLREGGSANLQLLAGDYGSALATCAKPLPPCTVGWPDLRRMYNRRMMNREKKARGVIHDKTQLYIAKMLLYNDADVNLKLQHGKHGSALTAAAFHGRTQLLELFLEHGADVTIYGQRALEAAELNGHTGIVNILRERGVGGGSEAVGAVVESGGPGDSEAVGAVVETGGPGDSEAVGAVVETGGPGDGVDLRRLE